MPLRLGTFSQQVHHMAQEVSAMAPERQRFLEQAQQFLRRVGVDELRAKLDQERRRQVRLPWLVAVPRGPLDFVCGATRPPPDWCVVGCDSSSIPPDRHSSLRYYAVNVGYAVLRYGQSPYAALEARSQLCFRDAELYVFPERKEVPIEGALLNARMEIAALAALREVAPGLPRPTLALRDGPLVLWTLQAESEHVQQVLLRDFLDAMSVLCQERVALGGYISFSDARDVVNSLRAMLCPTGPDDCSSCTMANRDLCLALASLRDRELFGFLAPGERSQTFGSSSQILEQYGEHRIDFFYLNAGGEIARVEVPQWLSADPQALAFAHAALYDQCERSPSYPPYPPALQEAHEQAVISAVERDVVEEMVESALGRWGHHLSRSAKDGSKRRRGV